MNAKRPPISETLDHLLISAAGSVALALVVSMFHPLAAALVLACLFGLELLIAISLAHRAASSRDSTPEPVRPVDRVMMLRGRNRFAEGLTLAPLSPVEVEELRVLEAGLDSLGIRHRQENARRAPRDRV